MKKLTLFIILLNSYSLPGFCEGNLPDRVVWGRYCGECVEDCSIMREISGTGLNIDKTNNFFDNEPFEYVFKGVPEPDEEYQKYKWILNEPVPDIITGNRMVFGEPDAYDQCGYYLMYSINSVQYKVLVDTEKLPEELELVVTRLFHEAR